METLDGLEKTEKPWRLLQFWCSVTTLYHFYQTGPASYKQIGYSSKAPNHGSVRHKKMQIQGELDMEMKMWNLVRAQKYMHRVMMLSASTVYPLQISRQSDLKTEEIPCRKPNATVPTVASFQRGRWTAITIKFMSRYHASNTVQSIEWT